MNVNRFRLPLATRIFLMSSLLLIFALGSIVFATFEVGKGVAKRSVKESLANSLALQNYFRDLNDRELLIVLDGFASDPNFSGYVAEAIDATSQDSLDVASVADLIQERKEDAELDFIILLDPEGRVIVHSEKSALTGRDLSNKLLLAPVIEELNEATGIWLENDQMFQAAVMPLSIDYDLVGFVVAGLLIDKNLANEIKQVGGGDTMFMVVQDGDLLDVASTLDIARSEAITNKLKEQINQLISVTEDSNRLAVELNEQDWTVQVVHLSEPENGLHPMLLIFSSSSKYMEGYNQIFNVILIAAIIAISVSIAMSLLLTSGVLNPIRKLALAAKAAAKGDYSTQLGLSGSDELADLSNSIERLLSDLRDKQDMQDYISELSKILPDETKGSPKVDANQKLPVTSGEHTLLAIDVSGLIHASKDPQDIVDQLQKLCDLIGAQIENANGVLIRLGGNLFIAAFNGEQASQVAYSTAGGIDAVFSQEALNDDKHGARFSLTKGTCYLGNIASHYSWQRVVVGKPVRLALRLVEEGGLHCLLISNDVYKSLKSDLDKSGQKAKGFKGRLTSKTLCALDLDAAHDYVEPLSKDQAEARQTLVSTKIMHKSFFDLPAGSVFAQRYEIIASLGTGSMGLVFKAIDKELNEPVALKILRKEIAEDKEHLERLRSEIKLARRVTHPNILRTYDLGKIGDTPFLSMEYVRGMTLQYLLSNSGKPPYSAALRVAKQLCMGLSSVHEIGILHRDIKAENVIIEPSGNLKLMDFGIARTLKQSEIHRLDEGMFVGTPRYASPEQIRGGELGIPSDIYSLGILLCEIFTGKTPIIGESANDILVAHVTKPPIPPSKLWIEIPAELEQIILKCLQKDPKDRYPNVAELLTKVNELSV